MPRIILDKNVLQAAKADELCALAKRNTILLPQVLLYEIVTDSSPDAKPVAWFSHLSRIDGLKVRFCRRLPDLFREEMRKAVPITSVISKTQTAYLHQLLRVDPASWPDLRRMVRPSHRQGQSDEVVFARKNLLNLASNDPGFQECLRNMRSIAQEQHCNPAAAARLALGDLPWRMWKEHHPCLPLLATPKSITFMELFLKIYQVMRRTVDGYAGMADKGLFNEVLDKDYLLPLVCADGLISGEKIVRETARAFFPGKLVWGSIGEAISSRAP